jgi:heme-degrading monooxygenase HmoA
MFTRIVEIRTKTGKARDFNATLNEKVLPILRKQPGFVDEITLVSTHEPDRVLALSFWDSEEQAERYNREQFPKIQEIVQTLLETAPKVQTFNVDTSTTHKIVKGKAA